MPKKSPGLQKINGVWHIDKRIIQSMMDIGYLTGMRQGDLLDIRLSDITPDGLLVDQGKTGKRQVFDMTTDLQLAIDAAKKIPRKVTSIYLLGNRLGQLYTSDGFQTIWAKSVKESGIDDFHFHDIRAKSATDAKAGGLDY